MEALRLEGNGDAPEMKRGWRLGAEDFVERLAERLGRAGASGERARERNETDEQLALRIMREALAKAGIAEGGSAHSGDGAPAAKGDAHDAVVDRGTPGDGQRELPIGTAESSSGR